MSKFQKTLVSIGSIGVLLAFTGCDLLNLTPQEPTKTRMEGIWQVTEAYNERGESILDSIDFPTSIFQLKSNNDVLSTAGPMMMYIVYGGNQYTKIASKIDQVMNYSNAEVTTDGEWFIENGYGVNRFTLEMKLEGLPGQSTITDILRLIGIRSEFLQTTIYHKFLDVSVTFDAFSDSVMTWDFDNTTTAEYNYKNSKGDYVLWDGWPTNSFSHCRFVLTKRVKTLPDLVKEAKN